MDNEKLENVRKWALACKDKNKLLVLRKNCRDRNNLEAVDIVENVLDIRYPNWGTADVARTRSGGIVPTNARFQSRTQKSHRRLKPISGSSINLQRAIRICLRQMGRLMTGMGDFYSDNAGTWQCISHPCRACSTKRLAKALKMTLVLCNLNVDGGQTPS